MKDKYDDIKDMELPRYRDLPPMSANDRAAQFSPFAALVGYDDAVAETARLVDSRLTLTEDRERELNDGLNRLLGIIGEGPEIRLTYFVPDKRKQGGRYIDKVGIPRIYDSYARQLVFTDGERVSVEDMFAISFTADEEPGEECGDQF
ncbi:MAG: hypothetical protein IJ746_03225 [Ruminococcus sp.]|nr:hypothetical protein [Ruminococcus sp.]